MADDTLDTKGRFDKNPEKRRQQQSNRTARDAGDVMNQAAFSQVEASMRKQNRQHNANAREAGRAAGAARESQGYQEEKTRRAARTPERGGNAGPLPGTAGYGNAAPYTPPPASVPNPTPGTYTPPIPGGGIAARRPSPTGTEWTPSPAMALVLGAGLMILTVFNGTSSTGSIIGLIWTQNPAGMANNGFSKLTSLGAEGIFVLVLYILANLSDTMARIVILFELGLYLILLVLHPGVVTLLATAAKHATGG